MMKGLKPNMGRCQECGKNEAEWRDLKDGAAYYICGNCIKMNYTTKKVKRECSGKK